MTEQEFVNLKKRLHAINARIIETSIALSNVSFEEIPLRGDLLKKELEIIEKIFKEDLEKIQEEENRYHVMKGKFLRKVNDLYRINLEESENLINIDYKKNYYVVSCSNMKAKHSASESMLEYGSYACVFDEYGDLLLHGGKIETLENGHLLKYDDLNIQHSTWSHYQIVDNDWHFIHEFSDVQSIRKCSDKFLEIKYESAPEMFNEEDNNNRVYNELYNIEIGKVVLQNFGGCKKEYPEFKNIEPNQYLLITKKIKLSDSDNTARLQFFIDLDGKLVSDVLDLERGIVYPLDQNKEQQEALQDIYQLVLQNLEEEAKEITNIYQLKLKK